MTTTKKPAKAVKLTAAQRQVAGLVDELYKTREKRYALQRTTTALEEQEKAIRLKLISALPKFGATGLAGKVARAQLEGKVIVKVADASKFHKYIVKHDAWDLLQQRVSVKAVQDRWDAKQSIPGVVPETVTVVSLHKL